MHLPAPNVVAWLQRPTHISWHIAAFAAGVLFGVSAVVLLTPAIISQAIWLAPIIAATVIPVSKRYPMLLMVLPLLAGMLLGWWHGNQRYQELTVYEDNYGDTVLVSGAVALDPAQARNEQQLQIDDIRIDEHNLPGVIWLNTDTAADIKRGDDIAVAGVIEEGFGNFAGAIYQAELIEAQRPYPGDIGRRVRDWFSERIRMAIPEPEATLGISYVTGYRQALPDDISEQLKILGLTHLVVASGFHLTIMVRFARRTFANRSKYLATLSSSLMIFGFLLITGFSTSMTRASLVAGLSLLAWYYGRNIHPVTLLLIVAAATVVLNPAFIWGDMGWYLSFAAFLGVIILAPLLNSYFFSDWGEPGTLRHIFLATTAAQITTFPIVALAFGHYSPLALVANLAMLPLVPITMLLTAAGGATALVSSFAAAGFTGLPAYGMLLYMTHLTEWLAGTPWAAGEIEFGMGAVLISYAAITAGIFYLRFVTGHRLKQDNAIK